jgi:hypothetical protein
MIRDLTRTTCLLLLILATSSACASSSPEPTVLGLSGATPTLASTGLGDDWEGMADDEEGGGFLHGVLLYLPNRIFDILDIVRARVRLGPGIGVGVRATELADVFVGSYVTVFVGIHGPRGETKIPWPAGLESSTGVEVSVADATIDGPIGPDYGLAEFGVDGQFAIVGFAVGVDPFEVVDALVGFLTFDLMDDDY